jgi:hypothetical protein
VCDGIAPVEPAWARLSAPGMIVGVPSSPVLITDPGDERVADFRDLVAGDRKPGTERGTAR